MDIHFCFGRNCGELCPVNFPSSELLEIPRRSACGYVCFMAKGIGALNGC